MSNMPSRARPNGSLPMPRTQAVLIEIESLLAAGKSIERVKHEIAQKHGYTRRHIRRLLSVVYGRWAQEAEREGRDAKKSRIRTSAWNAYEKAMARLAMALDKEGGEHYYDSPDAGAAVRALELLCRLDGLMEQPGTAGASITLNLIQMLQQHYGIESSTIGRLAATVEVEAEDE